MRMILRKTLLWAFSVSNLSFLWRNLSTRDSSSRYRNTEHFVAVKSSFFALRAKNARQRREDAIYKIMNLLFFLT